MNLNYTFPSAYYFSQLLFEHSYSEKKSLQERDIDISDQDNFNNLSANIINIVKLKKQKFSR